MLKVVKTRKIIRALQNLGFKQIRQRGDHTFWEHRDGRTTLIPLHPEIRAKLLTKIIKEDLKIKKAEFEKRM